MKTKTIELLPSPWKLDVIVTSSRKKAINYQVKTYGLKKALLKEEKQHLNTVSTIISGAKTSRKGETRIVLILDSKANKGVVVHELMHVMWHMSKRSGTEMNYESQEWQALMIEHLFNKVTSRKGYKKH